ncbi:MAG: HlyD family efflux transporter periplasmic adaptor subunit [Bacteroidota bacterium]
MSEENGQEKAMVANTSFSDIEINDLIGEAPGWILRSGISILCLVTLVIGLFSVIIRFPDKIQAPLIITTENPPIAIIAKANGPVEKLFVEDRQKVEQGEVIAYLQNTTKLEDVKQLNAFIHQFEKVGINCLALDFPEAITLGTFQSEVTAFEQKYNEFKSYLQQKSTQQRLSAFEQERQKIDQLNSVFKNESKLLKDELRWNVKDKNRFENLKDQQIVSVAEYEQREIVVVQQKRQLERINRELIQNEIRQKELQIQGLELLEERKNTIQKYLLALKEMKNRIANLILEWEDKYFLRAAVAGTCNLPVELVENKVVTTGETVAYIIPGSEAGQIVAHAKVDMDGIGKIEEGNSVLMRLDPYPYKEFGIIESEVMSISLLPSTRNEENRRFYNVVIPIGTSIKTDYNKAIPYRPNMSGVGHIITKDKSLFYRVFEQIIRLLKE